MFYIKRLVYKTTNNFLSTDPPPGNPTLRNIKSLVLYEEDHIQMTCDIIGGSPLANLSWDCPGLDSQTGSDSSKRWSTVSGTVRRTLNSTRCACTAQHYAWLPPESQTRTVHTPLITVYCKYLDWLSMRKQNKVQQISLMQ